MGGVGDRRERYFRRGRSVEQGPRKLRQTGGHHRPHRQGAGRFVHAGRQQLALPRSQPGGSPGGKKGTPHPVRNAFAKKITELAKQDDRVVLLSGDIGNRLFDDFKARVPTRFYNCGVAEANMMGVAAGLAMSGLRPVCYTITPFITYRCMEQIRVDVCYHHVPVVIVGTGSGLSYASLGATHHSCEEMGMLRLLPGLTVLAPADAMEVRGALEAVLKSDK